MSAPKKILLGSCMVFAWIFSGFDPISARLQRGISQWLPFEISPAHLTRALIGDSIRFKLSKLDGELEFKEPGDFEYRKAQTGETFSGNVALRTWPSSTAEFQIYGANFEHLRMESASYLVFKETKSAPGNALEARILGGAFVLNRAAAETQKTPIALFDSWNGRTFTAGNKNSYRIEISNRPEYFAALGSDEIQDATRSGDRGPETFSLNDEIEVTKTLPTAPVVKEIPAPVALPLSLPVTAIAPIPTPTPAAAPEAPPAKAVDKLVDMQKSADVAETKAPSKKARKKKSKAHKNDLESELTARAEVEKPKPTLETKRQEIVAPAKSDDHRNEMQAAANIQRSNASSSSTESLFNSALERSLNELIGAKLKAGDCQGAKDLLVNSKAGFQGDPQYDGWLKRWQGRIKKTKCSG